MSDSLNDKLMVEVVKVRRETADTTTLYFARPFDFTAGQYITVFVPGSEVAEGKAYSLSSLPSQDLASITVKNVGGEFSSFLCSRRVGDKLCISRAYGYFNPETARPLVGITGGCGLSPIWSVLASCPPEQPASLHYSVKKPSDLIFKQELADSNISCNFYSTRQRVEEKNGWHNGRFDPANIVRQSPDDAHFLLCGALDFVREVRQGLLTAGVKDQQISTEIFFES